MKSRYRLAAGWLWCACAALLAMWSASGATDDAAQLDRRFRSTTLTIATPDARVHTFSVWVADDPARRARGLMFVKRLDPDRGMLFLYEHPQRISMWMKNTYIPLDMLFFDAEGRIVHVAADTEPHSLATVDSREPAIGVIELNAGTAAKLNIRPGARITLAHDR